MVPKNDSLFLDWILLPVDKFLLIKKVKLNHSFIIYTKLHYTFQPIFYIYRHVLVLSHFNENSNRQKKTAKDGHVYTKVVYPKYQLGAEIVKEIPLPPTYSMYYIWCIELFSNFYALFSAYVADIKSLVFDRYCEQDFSECFKKYDQRKPGTLTSQFVNRKSKEQSIIDNNTRRSSSNILYPNRKYF